MMGPRVHNTIIKCVHRPPYLAASAATEAHYFMHLLLSGSCCNSTGYISRKTHIIPGLPHPYPTPTSTRSAWYLRVFARIDLLKLKLLTATMLARSLYSIKLEDEQAQEEEKRWQRELELQQEQQQRDLEQLTQEQRQRQHSRDQSTTSAASSPTSRTDLNKPKALCTKKERKRGAAPAGSLIATKILRRTQNRTKSHRW